MPTSPSVVITGTSTGIGWGAAKVLIQRGFRVFGTVRKQSDADRLTREFGPAFTPLLMDVTNTASIHAAAAQVAQAIGPNRLAGLVNNAGICVTGPLLHISADELRRQMDVNVTSILEVSQAFAPLLGTDPNRLGAPGRILNVSSVGGKLAFPFVGAYIASKHAVEGLSLSLRHELLLYGIDVIVIGPGAVATSIWDKAEQDDYTRFAATPYGPSVEKFAKLFIEDGRKGLAPEQLGQAIHTALTARNPKPRYAVVPQPLKNWILPRLLPTRTLARLIGKQVGLLPS